MDIKEIKALAKILDETNLTSLEVGEGENRIVLKRELSAQPAYAPACGAPCREEPFTVGEKAEEAFNFNDVKEIKSPLVGVFFASPSPDAKPFAKVGDKVKKGQTLCIIEAMKLMNEITSDRDGEIADVCVKNGDVVEYGQPLFKLV